MIERRPTRPVGVGEVVIGANNPIVVQTMITEDTQNISGSVEQIIQVHSAGAEIARLATPTLADARALPEIKNELKRIYKDVPLIADVHHQGTRIAVEAAKHVEGVRINPGLFVFHKRVDRKDDYSDAEIAQQIEEITNALLPVIRACKEDGRKMRIGVNHGSLAERLTVMYGDTPEGMVQSALEYIKICEEYDFRNIVVSLKASRVPVMVAANQLMVKRMNELNMNYPIHLGVTEAGKGQYARVKSVLGIGQLLSEGIGDTIRVSLAEDPVEELSVGYDILQGLGLRITKSEFIACPTCARTKIDVNKLDDEIQAAVSHLGVAIYATMGCVVNGPGEMADANYGVMGLGEGKVVLYRGREEVRNIPETDAVVGLIELLKEDGIWFDPPESTT